MRIHPVFHSGLLIPYKQGNYSGRTTLNRPDPEVIEGEEEYEIEAILAHRGKGQRQQFLVKWLGYADSENEWLPTRELSRNAKDILTAYRKTHKLA